MRNRRHDASLSRRKHRSWKVLIIGGVSSGLILIHPHGIVDEERIISQASSGRLSSTKYVGCQTCSCRSTTLTGSVKMMRLAGRRWIINRIRQVMMSKRRKLCSIQESLEFVDGLREGIPLLSLQGTLLICIESSLALSLHNNIEGRVSMEVVRSPRAIPSLICVIRLRKFHLQFLTGEAGILCPNFLDCLLLCLFDLYLATRGIILDGTSVGAIAEMSILFACNVFLTQITHAAPATRACHFVATELLDDFDFASRTVANQSLTHGFFDQVALRDAPIFFRFFTRLGYVGDILAQPAADHFTGRVAATELPIFFNWWADGLEFAKWAAFQPFDAGTRDLVLLLESIQFCHHRKSKHIHYVGARKASLTTASVKALKLVLHEANLCLCRLADAGEAEEMNILSFACYGSVWRNIRIAALALYQSSGSGVLLLVPSLGLFLPFLIVNELCMHWSAKANLMLTLTEKLTSILGKL